MSQESLGSMILSPVLVATGDPAGESLENFNTNVLANGAICYVEGGPGQGEWQLQKEAVDAPDGVTIVEPISGPGRWFIKLFPGPGGGGGGGGITSVSGTNGIGITNPVGPVVVVSGALLLPRDGSRPMTGDLDLDGNDILMGAGDVTGTGSFTGTDFNGVALTTGGSATSYLNEAGNYVSIAIPTSVGTNILNSSDGAGGWNSTVVGYTESGGTVLLNLDWQGGAPGASKSSQFIIGDNTQQIFLNVSRDAGSVQSNRIIFNSTGTSSITTTGAAGSGVAGITGTRFVSLGGVESLSSGQDGLSLLLHGGNASFIGADTGNGGSLVLRGGLAGAGGGDQGFVLIETQDGTQMQWPASDGASGDVLTTDGSGVLSFAPAGGGIPVATIQNIAAAGPTAITNTMNTLARVNFAGAAAVSLPAGALGKQIIVKDVSGNASANPITVSGGTIDGAANHIISTNYGSATFICASTGPDVWDVV